VVGISAGSGGEKAAVSGIKLVFWMEEGVFGKTYTWLLNGRARLAARALGAPARRRDGDNMTVSEDDRGPS
jgi:hypothetical protein